MTVDFPDPFSPTSTVRPGGQFEAVAQELRDRRDRPGPPRRADLGARISPDPADRARVCLPPRPTAAGHGPIMPSPSDSTARL